MKVKVIVDWLPGMKFLLSPDGQSIMSNRTARNSDAFLSFFPNRYLKLSHNESELKIKHLTAIFTYPLTGKYEGAPLAVESIFAMTISFTSSSWEREHTNCHQYIHTNCRSWLKHQSQEYHSYIYCTTMHVKTFHF